MESKENSLEIFSALYIAETQMNFDALFIFLVVKYFEKNGTGHEKYCFGYIGSPPDISKSNFGDFGGGTLVLKLFCLCRYQFEIWCEFLKFNLVNIIYNDQNPFYCDFSILGKNPGPNRSAAQHSLLVKLFCPLSEDTEFLHVIHILNLRTFLLL